MVYLKRYLEVVFIDLLISIIITISIIIFIYSTFIERNILKIERLNYKYKRDNILNSEITIVQFSDTQIGRYFRYRKLEKVINRINSLNPDIIFFNGDLIDGAFKNPNLEKIASLLSNLNNDAIKIAIYGNHDRKIEKGTRYKYIMEKANFLVLKNSSIEVTVKGIEFFIAGTDDAIKGNIDIKKTLDGMTFNRVNILLIHEPDIVDCFRDEPFNICLAGHSHGGQIALPLIGPLCKNTLCKKYNTGLYYLKSNFFFEEINKRMLYVNTGLGNTALPFRLGNIPLILEIKLTTNNRI